METPIYEANSSCVIPRLWRFSIRMRPRLISFMLFTSSSNSSIKNRYVKSNGAAFNFLKKSKPIGNIVDGNKITSILGSSQDMQRTRQLTAARSLSFYSAFRTHSRLRELKLISNSPYSLDIFRIRIFLQLPSQTGDHTLYCVVWYSNILFPHISINLLFRELPARISCQKPEKIKLISCKLKEMFLQPCVSTLPSGQI